MSLDELYDFYNGNIAAMARELGISRQALHQRLNKLGIRGTGARLNKACTDLIKNAKLSRSKLAKETGFSLQTISKHTKKMKLPHANLRHSDHEVIEVLKSVNWNKSKASKIIGYQYNSFIRMLKTRGIKKPQDLSEV